MSSMNQCFNIVYLAGGFTHALNDVLHGAERERLGVPVFKLTKDHWYPTPRKLRQDFLGAGVKLYAILARASSVVNIHLMRAPAVLRCFSHAAISLMRSLGSSIRRSRNWPRSTPISTSTMLSQLACC